MTIIFHLRKKMPSRSLLFVAVAGVAVVVGAWAVWSLSQAPKSSKGASASPNKEPGGEESGRRTSLDQLRDDSSSDNPEAEVAQAVESKLVRGVKLERTFVNAPVEAHSRQQRQDETEASGQGAQGQFPHAEPNRAQATLLKLWLRKARARLREQQS